MDAIFFGDGNEPWSVARGGIRRWMHCRTDITELSEEQYVELATWLATRGVETVPVQVLVTRDDAGSHRLHAAGVQIDVTLADLPVWLQRPEQPKPAKATKARK